MLVSKILRVFARVTVSCMNSVSVAAVESMGGGYAYADLSLCQLRPEHQQKVWAASGILEKSVGIFNAAFAYLICDRFVQWPCQTVYALVVTCGPSLLRHLSSGLEGLTVLTAQPTSAWYGSNQNRTGTLLVRCGLLFIGLRSVVCVCPTDYAVHVCWTHECYAVQKHMNRSWAGLGCTVVQGSVY